MSENAVADLFAEQNRERIIRKLTELRYRRVEARIKVLLANGTKLETITRLDDKSCRFCQGTGISLQLKLDDQAYFAEECPRCFGIALIDPSKPKGVLEFRNLGDYDPEDEGWGASKYLVPPREWAAIASRIRLT